MHTGKQNFQLKSEGQSGLAIHAMQAHKGGRQLPMLLLRPQMSASTHDVPLGLGPCLEILMEPCPKIMSSMQTWHARPHDPLAGMTGQTVVSKHCAWPPAAHLTQTGPEGLAEKEEEEEKEEEKNLPSFHPNL